MTRSGITYGRLLIAALVVALTILLPDPAQGQEVNVLTLTVGDQSFERAEPATLEDSLKLLRAENALLNKVIAAYLEDGTSALANVKELMSTVTQIEAKTVSLAPVTIKVPMWKTLAVGGFLDAPTLALGASAQLDFAGTMTLGADVGIQFQTLTISPTIRFRGLYWLF